MVLEQGALTGRYNEAHPFPAGTGRGDAYNPHLKELSALIEELSVIGTRFNASPARVATAWAISKGTLPIIGMGCGGGRSRSDKGCSALYCGGRCACKGT